MVGNACAPSRNRRVTDLGLVTASATLASTTIPSQSTPLRRRSKNKREGIHQLSPSSSLAGICRIPPTGMDGRDMY